MASIEIDRGDDEVINLTVYQSAALTTKEDLTGAGVSLWFTAKKKLTDADTAAVIRKGYQVAALTGITMIDAVNGRADIAIASADTITLPDTEKVNDLKYDIQYKNAAGKIKTIAKGTLRVWTDVQEATV